MTAPAAQREATERSALPPRRSPYQGLLPYSEEDADYFFGRRVWTGLIIDHLLAYRVTLLYGPSGVGKSSVLRAGVLHELRRRAVASLEAGGSPEILPAIVSQWSGDPVAAVEAALTDAAARLWSPLPFETPTGSLANVVSRWADRAEGQVLLVLDQFDEYFMYHENRPGGLAFVDTISEIVADREIPLDLLISIREDALAKLDRFESADFDLWQNLLRIDHLDADAAREAIEKPIDRWNERDAADGEQIDLGPGLVEAVVQEASAPAVADGGGRGVLDADQDDHVGARVEAPYLQLVMTRLWEEERRRGSRVLRLETLRSMGGAQQIVRRHFDSVMRALSRRQRARSAKILQYLVTPAGTKIALPASALAKWSKQKEQKVAPILATLAGGEQRILRTVSAPGDSSGAASYEIFHDRLADGILDWRRRFVNRRRMRRAGVLMLVLLAVGVAGVATALIQHSHNVATERNLAGANSRLRALERFNASAARSPFYAEIVTPKQGSIVLSAAYSPDGRTLGLGSPTGVEVRSPTAVHVLKTDGSVALVKYSPALDVLGVEEDDDKGGVWDGRSAKYRFTVTAISTFATLTFADHGRLMAIAGRKGVVDLWNVASGKLVAKYGRPHNWIVDTATISPDGRLVAAARGRRVSLWNRDGKLQRALDVPTSPVDLQFASDGRHLLTVSPGHAMLWDARTWKPTRLRFGPASIATPDEAGFEDLTRFADFSAGRVVLVGTNHVSVWTQLGKLVVSRRQKHRVTYARFSPDGRLIATADAAGGIRIWSAAGRPLARLLPSTRIPVSALAFRGDGRFLVSGHDAGAAVIVWKIAPDLAIEDTSVAVQPAPALTVTVAVANRGLRASEPARLRVTGDGVRRTVPVRRLPVGGRVNVAVVLRSPSRSTPSSFHVRVIPSRRGQDASNRNNAATVNWGPVLIG